MRNSQLPPDRQNPLIPPSYTSLERENDGVYGAAIVWNLNPELRFGASIMHSESEMELDADVNGQKWVN